MAIDPKLVKILQCPDCQGSINYQTKPEKLSCKKCKRVFKIGNGIPIMLPKDN